MNKKAITILGAIFLLIVGTLGFLIFQRRANNAEPTPVSVVPTPTPGDVNTQDPTPTLDTLPTPEPTPDTGNVVSAVRLTEDNVVSPVLFYQGNGVAYFNTNSQLFQADLDASGSAVTLTNKRELGVPPKPGITKVYWPSAGNNYVAEIGSGSGRTWSVYVSDKGTYVDMPPQVTSFAWMPDGELLLYLWLENGKSTLNVSPADLSSWQTITDFWEPDDEIAVAPNGSTILFWRRDHNEANNAIHLISPDGKLFRTVVKDGYNTGVLWSPDSQKFAFNKKTSSGMELWVADVTTGEAKNMNVVAQLDSVVWALNSSALYVSTGTTTGSIIRVDPSTGAGQSMVLAGNVQPKDLFMSVDGSNLFFKNASDGGLYYVNVSQMTVGR